MTLPSRKNYRLKNFDYNTNGTYFVTVCVKDRKRILSEIVGAGVLSRVTYFTVCVRTYFTVFQNGQVEDHR